MELAVVEFPSLLSARLARCLMFLRQLHSLLYLLFWLERRRSNVVFEGYIYGCHTGWVVK